MLYLYRFHLNYLHTHTHIWDSYPFLNKHLIISTFLWFFSMITTGHMPISSYLARVLIPHPPHAYIKEKGKKRSNPEQQTPGTTSFALQFQIWSLQSCGKCDGCLKWSASSFMALESNEKIQGNPPQCYRISTRILKNGGKFEIARWIYIYIYSLIRLLKPLEILPWILKVQRFTKTLWVIHLGKVSIFNTRDFAWRFPTFCKRIRNTYHTYIYNTCVYIIYVQYLDFIL